MVPEAIELGFAILEDNEVLLQHCTLVREMEIPVQAYVGIRAVEAIFFGEAVGSIEVHLLYSCFGDGVEEEEATLFQMLLDQ